MGRVLTNNTALSYAIEESLGTLPAQPEWLTAEPNSIGNYGATITTVSRDPISKNRQRRKGTVTDLDSAVDFEADLTLSHFETFIEGFVFAQKTAIPTFSVSDVTATGYTVASGGALTQNTLVFARGFVESANNGLKVVGAASTATEIKVAGLTVENPAPGNATVEEAGFRAAANDLEIDASGNLTSTTLDFTTLGLTVGQFIHIGGANTLNQFATAGNNGYARITSITSNIIGLDKTSNTLVTDNGNGKEIEIYYGAFIRNVPTDDPDFLERSYQFELEYPNLDNPSGDLYEYAQGNYCNEVTFNLPLTDKATMAFGFIGTDAQTPTSTRATNADTPLAPNKTAAFNTSADIARLRITELDETGLTTDFKSIALTLRNNVSPEKVLGSLGARFMNTGNFEVDIETQLLFTNAGVADAVRNNTTVTMDFFIKNDDGSIAVDIPAMTLGGGDKEFPVNETVLINSTGEAFADPILGTSVGITIFPFVPTLS